MYTLFHQRIGWRSVWFLNTGVRIDHSGCLSRHFKHIKLPAHAWMLRSLPPRPHQAWFGFVKKKSFASLERGNKPILHVSCIVDASVRRGGAHWLPHSVVCDLVLSIQAPLQHLLAISHTHWHTNTHCKDTPCRRAYHRFQTQGTRVSLRKLWRYRRERSIDPKWTKRTMPPGMPAGDGPISPQRMALQHSNSYFHLFWAQGACALGLLFCITSGAQASRPQGERKYAVAACTSYSSVLVSQYLKSKCGDQLWAVSRERKWTTPEPTTLLPQHQHISPPPWGWYGSSCPDRFR